MDHANRLTILHRHLGASSPAGVPAGVDGGYGAEASQCHGTNAGHAHGLHEHEHDGEPADGDAATKIRQLEQKVAMLSQVLEEQFEVHATSGQGDAVFSWDTGLTAKFPAGAKPFEKDMHGGFNEDTDTGVVYTGIPGWGLCSISADLAAWTKIGTDARLEANIHGIVVFEHKGEKLIAVAQNADARVLIIALDGTVLQQIDQPKGTEFNFAEANEYYSAAEPAFACTDVTYLDGRLYVVTGYCDGDFVLCASEEAGSWEWGPYAWGGKGDKPGQFNTAHGIFAFDDHIFVANREAHQVLEFTKEGKLLRSMPDIPAKSRICNIAHAEKYFVMNALEPLGDQKSAPVYAHTGEKLLSTIVAGELGIPVLKNLHQVWPHYVTGADGERTLYLLMHGWNEGKFAVLKHEPELVGGDLGA